MGMFMKPQLEACRTDAKYRGGYHLKAHEKRGDFTSSKYWPVVPYRLKELDVQEREDLNIKYEIGLEESFIRGWALGVSEKTKHPTLVFDRPLFKDDSLLRLPEDGYETERFYASLSPICSKLRKAIGTCLHCNCQDVNAIIAIFKHMDEWIEQAQGDTRMLTQFATDVTVGACDKHDEYVITVFCEHTPSNCTAPYGHMHFEYTCTFTGMKEILLPIMSKGILIGLVMAGQVVEDLSAVQDKVKELLEKRKVSVTFTEKDWEDAASSDKTKVVRELKNQVRQIVRLYDRTIDAAQREILDAVMKELLREPAINNGDSNPGAPPLDQDGEMYRKIRKWLNIIRDRMGIDNFVLYWDKNLKSDLNIKEGFYPDRKDEINPGDYDWVDDKPELIRALFDGAEKRFIDPEKNMPKEDEYHNWAFFIYRPTYEEMDPIFLGIKYLNRDLYQRHNFSQWEERLLPNFAVLIHNTAATNVAREKASALEETNERLSHELGQVSDGMRWIIHDYVKSHREKRYEARNSQKMRNQDFYNTLESHYNHLLDETRMYIDDFEGQFQVVQLLAQLYLEDIVVKPDNFDVYRTFLNRWRRSFNKTCTLKNVHLHLDTPDQRDRVRFMYTDPQLLEHVLYNVINNAIKYSYLNTRIYVEPSRTDDDKNVLTIKNYGVPIGDNSVYKKGVRGDNATRLISKADIYEPGYVETEGKGFGLYWANRIVSAVGGTIEHKCKNVSPYYVPLMKPFIERYDTLESYDKRWSALRSKFLDLKKLPYNDIQDAYDKLVSSGEYKKIVTEWREDDLLNLGVYRLFDELRKPTYEVTFTITIPKYAVEVDQ